MWTKLKHAFRRFKKAKSGERFANAHEDLKSRGPAGVLLPVAGVILVVAGLLLGLIPGVPGVVLAVAGLALISTRSRKMARWLDWSELKCKSFVAWLRTRLGLRPKAASRK